MDAQGMSQQAFSSFIGIAPATLSSIFNGRTRPTINMVEAIKTHLPSINTDWLLFGEGSMYQTGDEPTDASSPARPEASEPGLLFADEEMSGRQEPAKQQASPVEIVKTEVKYVDKPQRRVVEIKVYYDDFTYESFVPSPKK